MTSATDSYQAHVEDLERAVLAPYAFTSLHATRFVDGEEVFRHYEQLWSSGGRTRLSNRTPLMIERDRILYSPELRRLTDKYHTLFQGSNRVIRNYTTQSLRMAHVTRAICRALGLNSDFAEAIALGAKVGCVPFVHAAKKTADRWLKGRIKDIDKAQSPREAESRAAHIQRELFPSEGDVILPAWVSEISTPAISEAVAEYVPWAAGDPEAEAYSSGKESYWFLSTDPFLRRPRRRPYLPETLFGIWRHTRGAVSHPGNFFHRSPLWKESPDYVGLSWGHATQEAYVVQYADDITWAIENVNDASTAAALAGYPQKTYPDLGNYLTSIQAPEELTSQVFQGDSGGMYTYFINDLVETSRPLLVELGPRSVDEPQTTPAIRLSETAEVMLDSIQGFLRSNVFTDLRVENRNRMLEAITEASLEILWKGEQGILDTFIERRGRSERWLEEDRRRALELLEKSVHRMQLAVDILASMSDQDVYDFSAL